jgi:hypothetical protein
MPAMTLGRPVSGPVSRRAGLALAAAAVALLAGCGDSMAYYQTRYIPSSGDEYSAASQLSWQGDREVYELPAEPPAVDESRPRVACKEPGEVFKGQGIIGLTDNAPPYPDPNPPIALARSGDESPAGALPPVKAVPVADWGELERVGAREPIGPTQVSATDQGPYPFEASGKNVEPLNMAKTRDSDDWCPPRK